MAVLETGFRQPTAGPEVGGVDFELLRAAQETNLLIREVGGVAEAACRYKENKNVLARWVLEGLDESLATLQKRLETLPASRLILPLPYPVAAPETNRRALVGDYQQRFTSPLYPNGEYDCLAIPVDNVTAVRALAYASTYGLPNPQLAVRIKTSIDTPSTYFAAPGEVAELPSPGSWFQLPLTGLNIDLLPLPRD